MAIAYSKTRTQKKKMMCALFLCVHGSTRDLMPLLQNIFNKLDKFLIDAG